MSENVQLELLSSRRIKDVVATYEELFAVPYEQKTTYYFGDYGDHYFKQEISQEAKQAVAQKAVSAMGITIEEINAEPSFSHRGMIIKKMCEHTGIAIPPMLQAQFDKIAARKSAEAQEAAKTASTVPRLFVDMDGTLTVFKQVDTLETLYQPQYFITLEPNQNVVDAVRHITKTRPDLEVFILSAVLTDSKYALTEKNAWLDAHLPEIDQDHRIFPPCGEDKKLYIPYGVRPTDYLLDDYTKNLVLWEPPARGIKLMNGINGQHGTWQGYTVDYLMKPEELAAQIVGQIEVKQPTVELMISVAQESFDNRCTVQLGTKLLDIRGGEHGVHFPAMTADEVSQWVNAHVDTETLTLRSTEPMTTKARTQQPRNRGGDGKIIQAIKAHFDIVQYAETHYGLHFKISSKGWLQCVEYDSMYIDPVAQTFVRHSRGVRGDIVDMVQHLDEVSNTEAISRLRKEMTGSEPDTHKDRYDILRKKQAEKKSFALPKKFEGRYSRLFGYLTHKRCISSKVISHMVKIKLLYESNDYHNAVFVGRDYDGTAKCATLRSTGEIKFSGEVEGGEKFGWLVNPNKVSMFIGEAPIDIMSTMTLLQLAGKDYMQYTYLATGGNPRHGMVTYHMEHNPNVKKVYLCHDNDEGGNKLAENVMKELSAMGFKGEIVRKLPVGNDFNDDLKKLVESSRVSPIKENNMQTEEALLCLTQE